MISKMSLYTSGQKKSLAKSILLQIPIKHFENIEPFDPALLMHQVFLSSARIDDVRTADFDEGKSKTHTFFQKTKY